MLSEWRWPGCHRPAYKRGCSQQKMAAAGELGFHLRDHGAVRPSDWTAALVYCIENLQDEAWSACSAPFQPVHDVWPPFGIIFRLQEISGGPVRRPLLFVRARGSVYQVWARGGCLCDGAGREHEGSTRPVEWSPVCVPAHVQPIHHLRPPFFSVGAKLGIVLHPVMWVQLFSFLKSDHLERSVPFQRQTLFLPHAQGEVCSLFLT